jgi:hypothetical protein
VIPRKGYLNVASVTQLEKDTLMVCYGGKLIDSSLKYQKNLQVKLNLVLDLAQYLNLQGKVKASKKYAAEIKFDFQIDSVGKLKKYFQLIAIRYKLINNFDNIYSVPDR